MTNEKPKLPPRVTTEELAREFAGCLGDRGIQRNVGILVSYDDPKFIAGYQIILGIPYKIERNSSGDSLEVRPYLRILQPKPDNFETQKIKVPVENIRTHRKIEINDFLRREAQ